MYIKNIQNRTGVASTVYTKQSAFQSKNSQYFSCFLIYSDFLWITDFDEILYEVLFSYWCIKGVEFGGLV